MFKNLSPSALGISGRQSELIELALTFGFRSVEVSIEDLLRKAQKHDAEHAARFLASGQLKLGSFELPIQWRETEEAYQTSLKELDGIAQVTAAAGGSVCYATVLPVSDSQPYHDNFELHRKRLTEMAEVLGQHQVSLGLALLPLPGQREGGEFQFIHEAEGLIALIKSITAANTGLYLDTWNWHFGGGTLEQLSGLGPRIMGVTVADAPEDVTVDTVSESQRLLPGDGVIDITALFSKLSEQGCAGPVALAADPSCFEGLSREATVQKCNQILDGLLSPKPPAAPAEPAASPAAVS